MAKSSAIFRGPIILAVIFSYVCLCIVCVLAQTGFVSIDCGATVASTDSNLIQWSTDDGYVKTGKDYSINANMAADFAVVLQTLRAFPQGNKSCYSVPATKGNNFLIRASFLYGNYDALSSPPSFVLIVDATEMTTIATSLNQTVSKTYFMKAKADAILVCLARINSGGIPFISSLELRPSNSKTYSMISASGNTDFYDQVILETAFQLNYGADPSSVPIRYPDDIYDRIWYPRLYPSLVNLSAASTTVDASQMTNTPPQQVMLTAITTNNNKSPSPMSVILTGQPRSNYIYLNMYFIDIRHRVSSDLCNFYIYVNGRNPFYFEVNIYDTYMQRAYESFSTGSLNITFVPAQNATLGPILNALDMLFFVFTKNMTYTQDVVALNEVRDHFKLIEYSGDPCMPTDYSWDWVSCSPDTPPRVVGLDLSNRNLNGTIPDAIANLTALTSLNLANNNLSGQIPANLLSDTQLQANYSGNSYLCVNGDSSCNSSSRTTPPTESSPGPSAAPSNSKQSSKSKSGIIIGAVCAVVAVVVIFVLAFVFCIRHHKHTSKVAQPSEASQSPLPPIIPNGTISSEATLKARPVFTR